MGGLEKHFTSHSVRKTTARKLQKAGMSNDKIISITGHKTEQRIKAYVDTDLEDHRYISTLLSNQRPQVEKCMLVNAQSWHEPHSLAASTIAASTLGAHAVHRRPIPKSVPCVLYSLRNEDSLSNLTLKRTKQQHYYMHNHVCTKYNHLSIILSFIHILNLVHN